MTDIYNLVRYANHILVRRGADYASYTACPLRIFRPSYDPSLFCIQNTKNCLSKKYLADIENISEWQNKSLMPNLKMFLQRSGIEGNPFSDCF